MDRHTDPLVHRHIQVAGERLVTAFDDMTEVYGHLGHVFGQQRRLILRAVYRGGLLPWPTPSTCYPHRHRWAGRRPPR
jgi:hypothetical protein